MSTQITSTEITDSQIARESAAFDMLQRQAKMFASSSLVPKEFQGNIANCAIGIGIAKRLGADPFMVLQNVDIIHGRPSFRATFLIAMLNASGRFEPLQFDMIETGKETTTPVTFEVWENQKKVSREIKYTYTPTTCVAYAKDKSSGVVIKGPPVSYDMAISEGWVGKSGSKWQTDMRELMIRYRAAAFFARLYAPDITLGMITAEEAQDAAVRDVTPVSAKSGKLFLEKTKKVEEVEKDIPAVPIYNAEIAKLEEAEAVAEVKPIRTLLERVIERLDAAGIRWSTMLETLQANGEGGENYYPINEAGSELLKFLDDNFIQLADLSKKGAK